MPFKNPDDRREYDRHRYRENENFREERCLAKRLDYAAYKAAGLSWRKCPDGKKHWVQK